MSRPTIDETTSSTTVLFGLESALCLCSTQVDEELEALLENGEGLYDEKQVVSLCRLMVRVETIEQKLMCLKLIQVRIVHLLSASVLPNCRFCVSYFNA